VSRRLADSPGAIPVVAAALAGAMLLAGCERPSTAQRQEELTGRTMGTTYSVKLVAAPLDLDRSALEQQIDQALDDVVMAMSTYEANSALSYFNRSQRTDWVRTSALLCDAVAGALALSRLTGGAFDVTVGPVVNLWGFGPDGSIATPPDAAQIHSALAAIGFHKLQADCDRPALKKSEPGLYVDLSAYAKGYAVDRVAAVLDANGLTDYLVEIGGELRVRGQNARGERWSVAVEQPRDDARGVQKVLRLTDAAVATSGDYRNFFVHDGRRYSHTIDPTTGAPVTHDTASVTVVADDATFADGLATGLLVLGAEAGLRLAEREGLAVYFLVRLDDGVEERMSSAFAAAMEPAS
jgi:thiamine biosynthesis lipoprotein